ncbi:hypothetical protein NGB36_26490 [Streptomyces sp. RB6PN25]|uniref:Uncharacterized protein n=1 Tax=Streptomyces humicola TaxID=2953240 RepID=A0ABT1Q5G1_9ACTN|nr:hypothetical protein [Streptomyces humicola]MCQ4084035.1 hypothetical protein [Streptomyces humicola]
MPRSTIPARDTIQVRTAATPSAGPRISTTTSLGSPVTGRASVAAATPTALPWIRTRRRQMPTPPLRVGIAVDVSGR